MRQLTITIATALALICTVPLHGCVGALPLITAIVSIASEAVTWIDTISDFVQRSPVDEALRAKISEAVQRARLAAIALQRAGRGAENLSREEIDEAFANFRQAYEALLALVAPLRVQQVRPDGLLGVDRNGVLWVPPPKAFGVR